MAQTDSRAGFRLPWSSERTSDSTETDHAERDVTPESGWPDHAAGNVGDAPATSEAGETHAAATEGTTMTEPSAGFGGAAPAAVRRPSKFLADLTRAMQAAAEEARALTLSQFQADAKTYVERIHDRSATEAANLRRAADDDVAAVREWSKAEIARIREETESRISARKARLEGEIEEHTALIEREVEGVQARVAAFEQEMADFFARLLVEDDPTRFATMAERLPEPPPFEEMSTESTLEALATRTHAAAVEFADPVAEETHADADSGDAEVLDAAASVDVTEGTAETAEFPAGSDEATGHAHDGIDVELDREAAFAAIQAAAEAAASAEVAEDAAARAEAVAEAIEIVGPHDESDAPVEGLPDVAAEGTADAEVTTEGAPDFDAAEAEAAASADATDPVEEIPVIADDALAARLADLLPGKHDEGATGQETQTTQVVVVGLVSVASIASFKRHLGRLAGVSSVGVSSGPDGEFLFAVHHAPDVVLRDVIPSMPSFQARVTGSGEGTLSVTAHDPESEN